MHQTIDIRRAQLSEIVPLRHEVLRAGLPVSEAIFAGDELPSSRHYGAFVGAEGAVRTVGCATLHASAWEDRRAWQLRGMATAPDFRRCGVGKMMLLRMQNDLLAEPDLPRFLWCNARTPAIAFYQSLGWQVVSEVFDIPTAGPHVRMIRPG